MSATVISPAYFAANLLDEVQVPEQGILSRTLHNDEHVKVVLFGFSAGHELSAHTAPMPATLYFLRGEATVTLGDERHQVSAGGFAHMPPYLNHAIEAHTPVVMLLVMVKAARQDENGKRA